MKIKRRKSELFDNGLTVTGPDANARKRLPSIGAAVSYAQGLATAQAEPSTHLVLDYDDVIFRVERDEHGIIRTLRGAR